MRPRDTDPEQGDQQLQAWRTQVARLQRSSYRNLRHAIANLCILIGFIAGLATIMGDDRTVPLIVIMVGGILAAATYVIKSWLLLGLAVIVVVVGGALAVAA